MTPKEISKMIKKEINSDWSITNLHGCDLKKCLIRPQKRKLDFHYSIREVWIVLEEYPETLDSFMIFFDEENNRFGLAEHIESPNYYGFVCNSHETFLKAFDSM